MSTESKVFYHCPYCAFRADAATPVILHTIQWHPDKPWAEAWELLMKYEEAGK